MLQPQTGWTIFKDLKQDVPGGTVGKNLPANAGDAGLVWSGKISNATEQLGPWATAFENTGCSPEAGGPRAELHQGSSTLRSLCTHQQ